MGHYRLTWDGAGHPNSIHAVWHFLTLQLREVKEHIHNITDEFYGREERIRYLCNINDALQVAFDNQKTLSKVGNYQELEELLKVPISECIRPRLLQKAKDLLKPFHDRTKVVMGKLSEAKELFKTDILTNLETYCSSYVKLGIADDEFYQLLQSKTGDIRDILKQFEMICMRLEQSVAISMEYFCDWDFSQELSIQFNCDVFPLLRIVPDLLQKLETVIDTAQDWLRSDKVYLDQIQKQIEKVQRRIKESPRKFEYNRIFSLVKLKQADKHEEKNDCMQKRVSRLKTGKNRTIKIEISVEAETLCGCQTKLRVQSSIERPHCRSHGEARSHSTRLESSQRFMKRSQLANSAVEVDKLNRKLKQAGKHRSKCAKELSALKGQLKELEQALKQRLRPSSKMEAPESPNCKYQIRSSHHNQRKISARAKYGENKNYKSQELHKAFQLIKNNIGFNWKDLARMLPYGPDKQLTEIDNEIKVIEYENQGQLKEQAYQSLLRWYNQCGRRASVDLLNGALRDINENRLADRIEEVCDNAHKDTEN